jgi:quercetin dioxygenase-like cupin family protein
MIGLAAPSRGSVELSSWRVRLAAGVTGPEHAIDREQVWMLVDGALEFTVDGSATVVGPGEAAVLPADVMRQVRSVDGPAEVLVCMRVGGTAVVPGGTERVPLRWAE